MDERSAYRKKGARLLEKQIDIQRQIEQTGTYAAAQELVQHIESKKLKVTSSSPKKEKEKSP